MRIVLIVQQAPGLCPHRTTANCKVQTARSDRLTHGSTAYRPPIAYLFMPPNKFRYCCALVWVEWSMAYTSPRPVADDDG